VETSLNEYSTSGCQNWNGEQNAKENIISIHTAEAGMALIGFRSDRGL
jgi:hypothetical protein